MKPEKLNLRKLPKNTKLQLFVRWDKKEIDDGGGDVELQSDGKIVFSNFCGNDDRVYGFCKAVVYLLNEFGYKINMPWCLSGHVCYRKIRED